MMSQISKLTFELKKYIINLVLLGNENDGLEERETEHELSSNVDTNEQNIPSTSPKECSHRTQNMTSNSSKESGHRPQNKGNNLFKKT